jgi:transcriptional regulator with XRE-family HTH domain
VSLGVSEVRGVVERVFARQDVLDACARRDLGAIVVILGTHGVTQGQIAELTGIGQGRLSEWATRKRKPSASSSFDAFADGLAIPPGARQALGLAPVPQGGPGPGAERSPGERAGLPAQAPSASGAARPQAGGPSRLQGLEGVRGQLDVVVKVLKAEQDRRKAGSAVRRPAWKNLVFTWTR